MAQSPLNLDPWVSQGAFACYESGEFCRGQERREESDEVLHPSAGALMRPVVCLRQGSAEVRRDAIATTSFHGSRVLDAAQIPAYGLLQLRDLHVGDVPSGLRQ